MDLPERRLEAVTERDIDMLLFEELTANSFFAQWFVKKVQPEWEVECNSTSVWHSLTDPELGESDLVLIVKVAGATHVILVENKVDAAPQPAQAERYRLRGTAGIEDGKWASFASCLVAPARYLTSERNTQGYNAIISYEDIKDCIRGSVNDPARREFKEFVLTEAIEQNRRGYVARADSQVTRFFTDYWEFAESVFPELKFSHKPSRPSGSTWAEFRPPQIQKDRIIRHKVTEGFVDLQIPECGARVDELNTLNQNILPEGLCFVQTAKSASLRFIVARVDIRGEFQPQQNIALAALKAAFLLMKIDKTIQLK
jgi:hypothetical protein